MKKNLKLRALAWLLAGAMFFTGMPNVSAKVYADEVTEDVTTQETQAETGYNNLQSGITYENDVVGDNSRCRDSRGNVSGDDCFRDDSACGGDDSGEHCGYFHSVRGDRPGPIGDDGSGCSCDNSRDDGSRRTGDHSGHDRRDARRND